MANLEKQVLKTIKEHNLIERGDKVLLGLSGGPDSLSLLHVLKGLEPELGFTLSALHLNHSVRADADEDAQWLEEHCAGLAVPLTVLKLDIPAIAKASGTTVEEAGRIERQKALLAAGADKVALAHNQGDQAETVLLRMLRGTGTHGLAAMEYKRADGLIRPLLDVSRADIEEYCAKQGLSPRIDSTNSSEEYTRNRVRLKLIPELESEYNPNIKECLARLAENAREDDEALAQAASEWFEKYKDSSQSLPIKELQLLQPAIFKRVIKLAFAEIGLDEDIAAVHLNSLKQAIDKNYGGKVIEFPKGYTALIEKGKLILRK